MIEELHIENYALIERTDGDLRGRLQCPDRGDRGRQVHIAGGPVPGPRGKGP